MQGDNNKKNEGIPSPFFNPTRKLVAKESDAEERLLDHFIEYLCKMNGVEQFAFFRGKRSKTDPTDIEWHANGNVVTQELIDMLKRHVQWLEERLLEAKKKEDL